MTISVTDQRKQNIIQAVGDYGKRLFYFIRGKVNTDEDAEDILQDVWLQFTNMMSASPVEQASAWLFRVARNRIIDKYRRNESSPLEESLDEDDETEFGLREILPAENANAETEQLRNIFWKELFAALEELPKEQQEVFVWNELEEISFKDISRRTGESSNTHQSQAICRTPPEKKIRSIV
jgi:RNA polymerase sigma factor (sigma-70 family)